jgi:hypothetical protein
MISDMTKDQLLEIVKRLPLTADGVPIYPGMWLHATTNDPKCPVFSTCEDQMMIESRRFLEGIYAWSCGGHRSWYSTPEAALAAQTSVDVRRSS